MSKTFVVERKVTGPTGSSTNKTTVASGCVVDFDFTLNASESDKPFEVAFRSNLIKAIQVTTDKDITIETNANDATGGDTLPVNSPEGFVWTNQDLQDNPFTNDVTMFYITNTENAACTGTVRLLIDNYID